MTPVIWLINAVKHTRTYLGHPDVLVEVDAGVWPVAPGHQVGIVWSVDDWATANFDQAHWRRNSPNAFGSNDENWFFELEGFPHSTAPLYFRYALFVDDADGHRSWDNNGGWNYELRIY